MKNYIWLSFFLLIIACNTSEKSKVDTKNSSEKTDGLKNPTLNKLMDDLNNNDSSLETLPDGFHEIKYPDGTLKSTGTISNGKKEGTWTYFRENGMKWSECDFLNGAAHGKVVSYHENGQVYYLGYFSNGTKSGIWMFYDKDGKLIKEEKMNK